jgi:hypothetical protein
MPATTPRLLRHGPALQLTEHPHFDTHFREHPGRGSNQSRSHGSASKAGAPAGSRQINAPAPGRTASRQIRTFTPSAPMHKYTVGYLARWAITGATNYVKSG